MVETTKSSDSAPAELTAVVDELLNQLSSKFSTISTDIITKMDSMSHRIDALEATIQANENARNSRTAGGDGGEKRESK